MALRAWHVPARLATGAFILNTGISKLKETDEEHQKQLHGMAANAYPVLESLDPRMFSRVLAGSEVALGAALLLPLVSPGLAGAGLTAFSGGLIGLYLRTPGMREHGSLRPSAQGMPVAKDVWMLAIGTGLLMDGVAARARRLFKRS